MEKPLGYLLKYWLQNMQWLLATAGIKLKIEGAWIPKEQRENDTIIMDYVRQQLPEWEWEPINRCRIYLQAVTFTEVASYDGLWISRDIYNIKGPHRKIRL